MAENKSISFLKEKKKLFKETPYRQRFDSLEKEIREELVNTDTTYGKLEPANGITSTRLITERPDGSRDFVDLPNVYANGNSSGSRVPNSKEPIAFSKILVAASSIASKAPDGTVYSVNKIKGRAFYDLLKQTWVIPEANGLATLQTATQNLFTYGWAAWRVFPKRIEVRKTSKGKKVPKILFDNIFRQPLDVRRTWFGLTYRPTQNNNRPEIYYEYDITKEEYKKMKERYGKRSGKKNEDIASVSDEALEVDGNISKTHVTIGVYENPLDNRLIIASSDTVFYDDEMPNDEIYGSVVVAHCYLKDINDPHGVGLYEMMRGNINLYNYINSLDAQQVEAEVFPIIFGIGGGTQQGGEMTYVRSPNRVNYLPAGTKLEIVRTTGNVTLGINFADKQKQNLEENTGVNNIVSGSNSETTLGATVILKEAALNRLVIPRNSLAQAIENDACISFSWFEQEFADTREFIFTSEDEVQEFINMNKMMHHEMETEEETVEDEYDENGLPIMSEGTEDKKKTYKVNSSPRVPMSFDYKQEDLAESDYENQNVDELGTSPVLLSRAKVVSGVMELDNPEKVGYDKVVFKVDTNSMIIPSAEIQKQQIMQLMPLVQSTLQLVYGLAVQDPKQAKAQLQLLKEFLDVQKFDLYKIIPKMDYDAIMSENYQPTMNPMTAIGGAVQSDGTSVQQPQSQQELQGIANSGSPMSSAFNAAIGRAAKG